MARQILLRRLAGAPQSRQQLADALARRGVDEVLADRLLDRFTEVGLIDDAEYARILVRSQRESRGLARRGLAMELRRRGVGDEDAAGALADVDDDAEEVAARRLLEKRWAATSGLDPQVRARRITGMLARKGYPAGLVARLVREALANDGPDAWHPEAPED